MTGYNDKKTNKLVDSNKGLKPISSFFSNCINGVSKKYYLSLQLLIYEFWYLQQ